MEAILTAYLDLKPVSQGFIIQPWIQHNPQAIRSIVAHG